MKTKRAAPAPSEPIQLKSQSESVTTAKTLTTDNTSEIKSAKDKNKNKNENKNEDKNGDKNGDKSKGKEHKEDNGTEKNGKEENLNLTMLLKDFGHSDLGLLDALESSDSEAEREAEIQAATAARAKSVQVLKRAHMGAAGRAQIPESGLVNYADGSDSSEDEGNTNRVGNIPMEWYADAEHIGYDVDGTKIMKKPAMDQIDAFLKRMDDPHASHTIYDAVNDRHVVLTPEELKIIRKIRNGIAPTKFDADAEIGNFYSEEKEIHPFGNVFQPKRRFVPSKHEAKMVMKFVNAIRNGWLKVDSDDEEEQEEVYLMWDGSMHDRGHNAPPLISAPKQKLPGHAESYRPPAEYLLNEEEVSAWEAMDPEDRPMNFLPKSYDSIRDIPLYDDFIKEKFERCLDLYLCPRIRRKRLQIDPDSMLPQLPKPSELRPFPTTLAIEYKGHSAAVRCISAHCSGQWLATGASDGEVRIWEVDTGRCMLSWYPNNKNPILSVLFNPNPEIPVLAVAVENQIIIYHTYLGNTVQNQSALELLKSESSATVSLTPWQSVSTEIGKLNGNMVTAFLSILLPKSIREHGLVWHAKGDYLASVNPDAIANAVLIHRLSKQQTQAPFSKSKGSVQRVLFHSARPILFVATQRHVRIYNLATQSLVKKLQAAVERISSISLHPGGDNLLIGSEDRRVCWFDMDLSTAPYKSIKYHQGAVNSVEFHSTYPLFASSSSDGSVHIFHGMVYADMMQNPLIVPVKILHAHVQGVCDSTWHPKQPWVFTAGSDKLVKLFH